MYTTYDSLLLTKLRWVEVSAVDDVGEFGRVTLERDMIRADKLCFTGLIGEEVAWGELKLTLEPSCYWIMTVSQKNLKPQTVKCRKALKKNLARLNDFFLSESH